MENQNTETTQLNVVSSTGTTTTSEVALPTNIAALMAASMNLDERKPVMELKADYWEAKNVGDFINAIYIGTGTTTHKDPNGNLVEKKAVKLLSNGRVYLNSGVLLVREFEDAAIPEGSPIRVTFTEERKLGAGKAKVYSLSLLG